MVSKVIKSSQSRSQGRKSHINWFKLELCKAFWDYSPIFGIVDSILFFSLFSENANHFVIDSFNFVDSSQLNSMFLCIPFLNFFGNAIVS